VSSSHHAIAAASAAGSSRSTWTVRVARNVSGSSSARPRPSYRSRSAEASELRELQLT